MKPNNSFDSDGGDRLHQVDDGPVQVRQNCFVSFFADQSDVHAVAAVLLWLDVGM
jgi:hypothetical protein